MARHGRGARGRTGRERELLAGARARLDSLDLYPRPVVVRRVRVRSTPWLFALPWFRRFHGYAIGPLIFVKRPLHEVSEDLIVHELTHVWQVQHKGLAMWLSYLVQGYEDNVHEVEARAAVRLTA